MKIIGVDTVGNEVTLEVTDEGHLKVSIEYVRPFSGDITEAAEKLGVTVTEVDYQKDQTKGWMH